MLHEAVESARGLIGARYGADAAPTRAEDGAIRSLLVTMQDLAPLDESNGRGPSSWAW